MQSPSKITHASASDMTPAVCGLQGWAYLPEGLLHSIVPLLNSFLELLAFAGTCRSWRAAFASYPSKSTFCTLLPPLLIQPHLLPSINFSVFDPASSCAPNLPSRSDDGHKLRMCPVVDLANMDRTLHCQIPKVTFQELHFAGSSYGHMICGRDKNCLVVDVFTGAKVLPPPLPFGDHTHFESAMLTAPLSSNNAHLIVCAAYNRYSISSLLDWPVGSDSWSELQLDDSWIEQIVEFNGQFIVLDRSYRLHTLSLAPQLGLQEIPTVWCNGMDECSYPRPWLVVCGDMLRMVDNYTTFPFDRAPVNYKAYRLDMSSVPAAWVEVKKLENYSLFLGSDVRSPVFSCASWGRWSGRSNSLYYADYYQCWVLVGLGDDADADWGPNTNPDRFKRTRYTQLRPFWVYPSMIYL